MKQSSLGIFYLDYSDKYYPKAQRKTIIGYTRVDLLKKISIIDIPDDYICWLQECRTPGYLIEGNIKQITSWIDTHLSNNFGQPWI